MGRLVKKYLRIDHESAWESGQEDGLTDAQIMNLITALYEVEFHVDVDDVPPTGRIVAVNGKLLSATDAARKQLDRVVERGNAGTQVSRQDADRLKDS